MQKKRDEQEKRVGFVITEHPSFRAAYVSGVFGGLDPNDGRIVFFLDRIKPGMRKEPRGAMQLEKINRELQVEIHMSPPQFASVARCATGARNRRSTFPTLRAGRSTRR